jgi:two-component system response regulator QseB
MRLLLVEDDARIAESTAAMLGAAGYVVETVADGEQAWACGASEDYDLIILDLGLPRLDGLTILRRWRSEGRNTPVLVLSARGTWAERVEGIDAGADDYLVKPITIDELAARLRALVRRSAGQAQGTWRHGALEYDPAAKAVRWKGRPVELTGRELALLEALRKIEQRVLSKSHLLEKLYDWSGSEPESNALEVHVHHLRRKIHPNIVRTVRGVGYALGPADA